MLTAAQCRAARALLDWSRPHLSKTCAIDEEILRHFELKLNEPQEEIKRRVRFTFEEAGIVFIPENGGGAGVRLKHSRAGVRALHRWEGEGGIVGEDDI